MKVFRKFLSISTLVLSLTACNLSQHVHKYKGDWFKAEEFHYRLCVDYYSDCHNAQQEPHVFNESDTCAICGYVKGESIDSVVEYVGSKNGRGHYGLDGNWWKVTGIKPHVYEDFEGDKNHIPAEPTCNLPGKIYKQCTFCKRIMQESTPPLGHLYNNVATSVDSLTKLTCDREDCSYEAYILDCTKTDSGWNATNGTNGFPYRMGDERTEADATWNIPTVNLIPDGNYSISIECKMPSRPENYKDTHFFNHALNFSVDVKENKDTSNDAPYRYQFSLNGSDTYINPDNVKTYFSNGMSETEYKYVNLVSSCYISHLASFTLHHGKIDYELEIKNVRLCRLFD